MKYFHRLLGLVLGFLPKRLPIGFQEFEEFCSKIFLVYNIPDHPSYRQTVATMIMHHSQASCFKSPHSFASAIRKAQANEVAYSVLMRAKEERKQAEAAPQSTKRDSADEPVPNANI